MPANLYVHFPFCRRKCRYCALYSRAGVSSADRAAYVRRLAAELDAMRPPSRAKLRTVYFGGGSPALCDLTPLSAALATLCDAETEFTVELHPLDVTEAKLAELKSIGVNRISMGVQSLDDATLADMGRGYSVDEAEQAFRLVRRFFDNAGIDLIVGYPGDPCAGYERLADWGLKHCSVYSLQNERGLANVPSDDWTLDRLRQVVRQLGEMGLNRYEISNYAAPGFECRHNFAVWRGEDYIGLGEGACGRIGLDRTHSGKVTETLTLERDLIERTIFRLRTREGLDVAALAPHPSYPSFVVALDMFVREGLLMRKGTAYCLTDRGTEVCDSILEELV